MAWSSGSGGVGIRGRRIVGWDGGSVGIGFAVPSWRIRGVIEELQANGEVDRSFYTGLNVRSVNARIAQALEMDEPRGLIVASVDADSPADRAGLQPYDIVLMVEGEEVSTIADIRARLVDSRAGDTVTLGIVRDGREQNVSLTLGTAG